MKIDKIQPIEGSRILQEQAERLSKRVLLPSDVELLGSEVASRRNALIALEAENVEPIAKPPKIRPGEIAEPEPLDEVLRNIEEDLQILSNISENISETLRASYNITSIKENNTIGLLKTLRDRIASLKLYAADSLSSDEHIAYSFTDGTKLRVPDSEFVATYIEEEGAITLPFSAGKIKIPEIISTTILDISNGVPGNNHDKTRQRHASIDTIYDSNIHTWFEYEKVMRDSGEKLTLALRLDFKEPTVINHIKVIPALIGAPTWPKIKNIQVDVGQRLVSIAQDVTNLDWVSLDEVFTLSPSSSKYAGYGAFTFEPKLARAIVVTIEQDKYYPIRNERGNILWRAVIALREVQALQIPFDSEGEFSLAPGTFNNPVRAIGILHNAKPFTDKDATITYSISTDGEDTWTEISPLESKNTLIDEAYILEVPTARVALKGKIKRNSEAFQGSRSTAEDKLEVVEKVFPLTTEASTKYFLDNTPETFVEAIQIGLGAVGYSAEPLFLGQATGSLGNSQTFKLPFSIEPFNNNLLVDNEIWIWAETFTSNTHKAYLYDDTTNPPQIILGDGKPIGQGLSGRLPASGTSIYLMFHPDKLPIVSGTGPYKIELSHQSDKIKGSTEIFFIEERQIAEKRAGPGIAKIEIPDEHRETTFISLSSSERTYSNELHPVGNQILFLNGSKEFTELDLEDDEYVYSADSDTGFLYLHPANTESSPDIVYRYSYAPYKKLTEDCWRYSDVENAIYVDSPLATPTIKTYDIEEVLAGRVLNLLYVPRVIKGSLKAVDNIGDLALALEVEIAFIDGAQEFQNLGLEDLTGFFSFDYKENQLYLPEGGTFPIGTLQYSVVKLELHYGRGIQLKKGLDFTAAQNTIEITPYFMNQYAERLRSRPAYNRLLARYDAKVGASVDGSLLEQFYSPVIRDIDIIGITIDPRLGTLESL